MGVRCTWTPKLRMGEARILLKLMNPDGELIEKVYHDGQTPCIQLTINRFDPFHSQESQVGADRQLARFRKSGIHRVCFQHVNAKPTSL